MAVATLTVSHTPIKTSVIPRAENSGDGEKEETFHQFLREETDERTDKGALSEIYLMCGFRAGESC